MPMFLETSRTPFPNCGAQARIMVKFGYLMFSYFLNMSARFFVNRTVNPSFSASLFTISTASTKGSASFLERNSIFVFFSCIIVVSLHLDCFLLP